MGPKFYNLVGQTPVPCSMMEWAMGYEGTQFERRVALTRLPWCSVSTVFLGLDHRMWEGGPPILFESMAFWFNGDSYEQERCATWPEAEAMHAAMVAEVSKPSRLLSALWRGMWDEWRKARNDWSDLMEMIK